MKHDYQDLQRLFARCFAERYQTQLVAGDDEPYYQPQQECGGAPAQIVFAHGFYASALHEVAHWCIAGEARRKLFDYGYWYEGDGRNQQQQQAFEQVERKPQAIEWLFSMAAGFPFQVSVDNLGGIEVDRAAFTAAVWQQVLHYVAEGLPTRAEVFARALAQYYSQPWPPHVVQAQQTAECA